MPCVPFWEERNVERTQQLWGPETRKEKRNQSLKCSLANTFKLIQKRLCKRSGLVSQGCKGCQGYKRAEPTPIFFSLVGPKLVCDRITSWNHHHSSACPPPTPVGSRRIEIRKVLLCWSSAEGIELMGTDCLKAYEAFCCQHSPCALLMLGAGISQHFATTGPMEYSSRRA